MVRVSSVSQSVLMKTILWGGVSARKNEQEADEYQLRQLRTVARSLSPGAAATLVHSFITICLDYCLSLYAGLPSVAWPALAVFPSAARLTGQISKFGHVSSYMPEVLHWLPIRKRIEYRVAFMVWRCQLGLAPTYLIDLYQVLEVVALCAHRRGG